MSTSLSSLVDNLAKNYKNKWKRMWRKKVKQVCNFICCENNKLNCKCKECEKRWLIPINWLIKKFPNVYQFCNGDTNKFVSLLRKGIYPYEYMDSWKRFDEKSLPDWKALYSELHLEDITDKGYTHAQEVFKELKLENLGDYRDLYVQSNTLLLADVFENFRIYEYMYSNIWTWLSPPELASQTYLKKTRVRSKLLIDVINGWKRMLMVQA